MRREFRILPQSVVHHTFFFTVILAFCFFGSFAFVMGAWTDVSTVTMQYEQQELEGRAEALRILSAQRGGLLGKLADANEKGVDVSSLELELRRVSNLIRAGQYQTAVREYSDISVQVDELMLAKEDIEMTIVSDKKKELDGKLKAYKAQGVVTTSVDGDIGSVVRLIEEKQFNEADMKIASVSASLDILLVKKKEADRVAAAASAQRAATAAVSASSGSHRYERKTVSTSRGAFLVDVITINLSSPGLRIVTDTANDSDCTNNCPTLPLMSYVSRNGGFAGINGTYFCPVEYPSCVGKTGSFDQLVYNTRLGKYLNDAQNKWSTSPLFTFDSGNGAHFYTATYQFGRGSIQAALANHPILVSGGGIAVSEGSLDEKSRTAKMARGALGVKGSTLYAVIGRSATVGDMAYVMQSLGVDNAINLDGGGSSAMVFGSSYKVGPGRGIPNAIIFVN